MKFEKNLTKKSKFQQKSLNSEDNKHFNIKQKIRGILVYYLRVGCYNLLYTIYVRSFGQIIFEISFLKLNLSIISNDFDINWQKIGMNFSIFFLITFFQRLHVFFKKYFFSKISKNYIFKDMFSKITFLFSTFYFCFIKHYIFVSKHTFLFFIILFLTIIRFVFFQ